MKTAGVVIDFYDDPSGSVLKSIFSDPEALPGQIKTAHILDYEERNVLRNEAYALVMVNEGNILRKFACVDPGNTMLSMAYFEKTASMLPEEAVGVAAEGLIGFCQEYGLEPTQFVKMSAAMHRGSASGMQRNRDSMKQPYVGDEVDWASRTNLNSLRGGSDQGRVIPMANQMKTAGFFSSRPRGADYFDEMNKSENLKKFNEVHAALAKKHFGKSQADVDDDEFMYALSKTHEHPHFAAIRKKHGIKKHHVFSGQVEFEKSSEVVDISGKEAPTRFEKKSSTRYALGTKYPLDSFADVEKAVSYFDENYLGMDPDDRHEYCVKTASRADELGIKTSELMDRYGSTEYAPDVEAHIISRQAICDSEWKGVYSELLEKKAEVNPDQFVNMLEAVDKTAGLDNHWGGHISDPWLSTYGGKTEKQKEASWSWTSPTGDLINVELLTQLARNGRKTVHHHFSSEITDAFCKDPVTIFESLPVTSKQIFCNMANSFR